MTDRKRNLQMDGQMNTKTCTDTYTTKRREISFDCAGREQIPFLLKWVESMALKGLEAGAVVCRLGRPRRNLDQNAKLWPMCTDVSAQVLWHGMKLSKEDWKDLFTGSLKGQNPMPGINGGVVFIGGGSSKLSVLEFCDLIESIYAFGSEHGVVWSEKSKQSTDWMIKRKAA